VPSEQKVFGSAEKVLGSAGKVPGIYELKHLKPFVSNGFNRNFRKVSRKKMAQMRYTSGSRGSHVTPSLFHLTRSRTLKIAVTDLFYTIDLRFSGT
jgi:hypothetical protein